MRGRNIKVAEGQLDIFSVLDEMGASDTQMYRYAEDGTIYKEEAVSTEAVSVNIIYNMKDINVGDEETNGRERVVNDSEAIVNEDIHNTNEILDNEDIILIDKVDITEEVYTNEHVSIENHNDMEFKGEENAIVDSNIVGDISMNKTIEAKQDICSNEDNSISEQLISDVITDNTSIQSGFIGYNDALIEPEESIDVDTVTVDEVKSVSFSRETFNRQIKLPIINTQCINSLGEHHKDLVNKYIDNCARIVIRAGESLLIELEDKTLYFNKQGIKEFELKKEIALAPGDNILVVNEDKIVSDKQLEVLNSFDVCSCIKRTGDINIILVTDRTIVINPNGWILDYKQQPTFDMERDIYFSNMELSLLNNNENTKEEVKTEIKEETKEEAKEEIKNEVKEAAKEELKDETANEFNSFQDNVFERDAVEDDVNTVNMLADIPLVENDYNVGDTVEAFYGDDIIEGRIVNSYNECTTFNILWDSNISSFNIKNIIRKK